MLKSFKSKWQRAISPSQFPKLNVSIRMSCAERHPRTLFEWNSRKHIAWRRRTVERRQMYKQFMFGTSSSSSPCTGNGTSMCTWENIQTLRRRIAFKIESVFRESLTCGLWSVHNTEYSIARLCEYLNAQPTCSIWEKTRVSYGCRRANYSSKIRLSDTRYPSCIQINETKEVASKSRRADGKHLLL